MEHAPLTFLIPNLQTLELWTIGFEFTSEYIFSFFCEKVWSYEDDSSVKQLQVMIF